MSYRIAGIDVHKKMLALVVSDVEVDGEYQFERVRYSSSPEHLRFLAERLITQQVEEVVMESTAQYWKPVWEALERYWKPICQGREGAGPMSGTLHLAQAQSNRGRRGRKKDFPNSKRNGVPKLLSPKLLSSDGLPILDCQGSRPTRVILTSTSALRPSGDLQVRLERFFNTSARYNGGGTRAQNNCGPSAAVVDPWFVHWAYDGRIYSHPTGACHRARTHRVWFAAKIRRSRFPRGCASVLVVDAIRDAIASPHGEDD